MGDFPVPPTDKFPTQIIGKLKDVELKIPRSNNQFLNQTMAANSNENGNNKILIGLKSGALKFINAIRSNARV